MKIAVLGLGIWGFCLARHLALNGHEVVGWTIETDVLKCLQKGGDHPRLGRSARGLPFTASASLEQALSGAELIVESVTTKGVRAVLKRVHEILPSLDVPLVLTSKGIEQKSFQPTPHVALEVLGEEAKEYVTILSGPSFAIEVARQLPTAVVCGFWNKDSSDIVMEAFSSNTFRVYPNNDVLGVALGGSLKNVIAIASGLSDGLGLGIGARAALVTRGLHEIVKLAVSLGCDGQTMYGLSGLGDLYLTCSCAESRNFSFGRLLSSGFNREEAEKRIGMVVEGANTCQVAVGLAEQQGVQMPIARAIYDILEGDLAACDCVERLMLRNVKEERL